MLLWCNPAIFLRIWPSTMGCRRLEWVAKGCDGFRWADWYGLGWADVGCNRLEWAQMGCLVRKGDGLQRAQVGCSGLRRVEMGYLIQKYDGLQWVRLGYSGLWWVKMSSWNYVHVTFMVRPKVLHVHVVFPVTDKCQGKIVVQLRDLTASGRKILGLGTGSHFCPFGKPETAFIPRFMVTNMN